MADGIRGVLVRCFDHPRVLFEEDIVSFHCLGSLAQLGTAMHFFF
jgi:hypothetical protein